MTQRYNKIVELTNVISQKNTELFNTIKKFTYNSFKNINNFLSNKQMRSPIIYKNEHSYDDTITLHCEHSDLWVLASKGNFRFKCQKNIENVYQHDNITVKVNENGEITLPPKSEIIISKSNHN